MVSLEKTEQIKKSHQLIDLEP